MSYSGAHRTNSMKSTDRRRSPLVLGIAGLAAAVLLSSCAPHRYKGTEYLDPHPAHDFELTGGDGEQVRLSELRGKVVILFFGFTSCPDVCPTTLSEAKQILQGLGEDEGQVAYLFVTVDPERDTPEALQRYVDLFHPSITGLSGSPEALTQVWGDYGIFVEKTPLEGSAQDYTVTHTARVFVIDAAGRLRLSYSFGTPYQDILQDVQHLLAS